MIPRVILEPVDQDLIFQIRRIQFPLRLAFSFTINKSHGQSLDSMGLYLSNPVFGHGQLYVALSRGRSFQDIKVFVRTTDDQGKLLKGKNNCNRVFTKNVVYHELLQ